MLGSMHHTYCILPLSSVCVATVGIDQECVSPNPDCGGTDEEERMVNGEFLLRPFEAMDP